MSKKMKKHLLSSSSFFIYGVLFFFFLYTQQISKPSKTIQVEPKIQEINQINDVFEDIDIEAYHKAMMTDILLKNLNITSKKTYVPKDISFDARMIELKATVGDHVFIRIFKAESILEVWIKVKDEYVLFKQYSICAFSGFLGPKLKEGDKQSPEGFYRVTRYLLNPKSKFHLSFNLGYPNKYDRAYNRTGSFLMVHGECASRGCYAMTNEKIEEIYKLVEKALKRGQRYVQVHAFPFYMTDENMVKHQENKWYDFWVELKEGYDYFVSEKLPPHIMVKNKHYTIHEANE
jgi:murein L,D-transpeptidase YafK